MISGIRSMSIDSRPKRPIGSSSPRRRSRPEEILSADPDFEWAKEVGRFVLAFGSIEHTSIACLYSIPRDPIGPATRALPLKQRLGLLRDVLKGREGIGAYDTLARIVSRVISFVDHRNLVAHSPLHYSLYGKAPGEQGVIIRLELSSTRSNGRRMGFDELCKLVDDVERLAHEFSLASLEIFDPDLHA